MKEPFEIHDGSVSNEQVHKKSIRLNPAGFLLRSPTGFFLPQTKDKAH